MAGDHAGAGDADSGAESATDASSVSDPFGVGGFIRQRREMAEMSVRRLAEVANALKISVETLYVKAGILPDTERSVGTVPEAIEADPHLTVDQRRALLSVYESFVAD
jgi:hypothetical protein